MNNHAPDVRRLLIFAICFTTAVGLLALVATIYSPKPADLTVITIVSGFAGTTLAGLLAALRGNDLSRKAEVIEERTARIDKAVNGKLDARLTAQDDAILQLQGGQKKVESALNDVLEAVKKREG